MKEDTQMIDNRGIGFDGYPVSLDERVQVAMHLFGRLRIDGEHRHVGSKKTRGETNGDRRLLLVAGANPSLKCTNWKFHMQEN